MSNIQLQGMEERFSSKTGNGSEASKNESPLTIRKVTGCGRNHGFQLVIDSQQLMTLLPKEHLTQGFKV